jgi:hypothetical protein
MYTIKEHIHRYSIWTAARASQRGLKNFKIKVLKAILENIDFKNQVEKYIKSDVNKKNYEFFHKKIANEIIKNGAELKIKITYGRASKIISIYLKTAIIIPNGGKGKAANIIHAPIDRILLKALSKEFKKTNWNKLTWTKFTETDYWILIDDLEKNKLPINWKLEQFWNPED